VGRTAISVLATALVLAACSPAQPNPTTSSPPTTSTSTTSTTPATTAPQTTTTAPIDYVAYVEDALAFLQKYHFRTDEIDWTSVRDHMLRIVEARPTADGAYTAIEQAIYSADKHPALVHPDTRFLRPDAAAAWNARGTEKGDPPTGERLPGDIGYLHLPGATVRSDQYETYASTLRGLIEQLDADTPVCGWIVDLRDHTMGDTGLDLTGLGSLVGTDVYLRGVGNDETVAMSYHDGHVLYDGQPVRGVYDLGDNPYEPHDPTAPVAVLTSVNTAGSGEAVLVSFLGRPDTRTFGTPTARTPTAPKLLTMPDGAMLWVTAYRDQDRLGRTYDAAIHPDELVLETPGSGTDATLTAATDWLAGMCGP